MTDNTDINNKHSCLYTELRALFGWPLKPVCGLYLSDPDLKPTKLILIMFVNHFAFRGVHMRICNAKDCKTGKFIKVKIDRVKLLVIFISLKI